ncbi:calcium-binding protein [Streptomyces sp. NPDC015346]|uniref:calcium-binding protein n=1 Tax=Streptomyces sp. NPDC015346 TaxID=3364954 RepID=UPI0037022042
MPLFSSSRRAGRIGTVSAVGLALVLSLPGVAAAAPGDLDPTFGGDGRVTTDVGGYSAVDGMAVQPDGKIVTIGYGYSNETSGDYTLVRYNPDGSLDPTFGGDGIVTTDFEQRNDEARALALQSDGKIVAVGGSTDWGGNGSWSAARYHPDGTLDTSFGDGGRVLTQTNLEAIGTAEAVSVQPDGRIVLGGSAIGIWTMARYNANGTLDPTFGGDGIVTTDFSTDCCDFVRDVALQSDGKIVAAGYANYSTGGFTLVRYNADGSLDTGFDGDGLLTTGFGSGVEGVVLQSDGKIVAAGSAFNAFAVARFHPNGSFDATFGENGRVTTSFGTGTAAAHDVVLQSDGRIVAAGVYEGDFALTRYNTGGTLDTSFGGDGRVTTDFGGPDDQANAVVLQSDGKIVAGGLAGTESSFESERALARYLGGGGVEPPPGVDLSVTKTGPTTLSIGDQATYTVRVTNNSTTTAATGVVLSDSVTGGSGTILSATPSQGSPCTRNANTADCALGTIPAGGSATVTLVVEPRTTGTMTDRATVRATEADPVAGNNTATAATTVNNARGCTIIGRSTMETLYGTSGNDVICALSGNDTVYAGSGNDTVHAGAGNDTVYGGYGTDRLIGQSGSDRLHGEAYNDTVDTRDGVSGNDSAYGGSGSDTCLTDSGDLRDSCP